MDSSLIRAFITMILVFVSLLFSVFLLTVKTKNKLSNQLMAFYFIIFAIHISVFAYARYIKVPYALDMLRDQIMLLAVPLLFLYVISCIYSDFKLQPKHALHFIPFILEVILYIPNFYLVSEQEKAQFYIDKYSNPEPNISLVYGIIISIFYIVLMFRELKKYKLLLLENYSQTNNYNYKWLLQLVLVTTLVFGFATFKSIYKLYDPQQNGLDIIRVIMTLVLLVFLCWIVLKSLYNPELFRGIDTRHQLVKNIINSNSIEKTEQLDESIKTLKNHMVTEEPFLDPTLGIKDLSEKLNMQSKDLSILINHKMGKHFFDFINEYRIEKAMEILRNPTQKSLTVLEILYEVGFNSKSSFNTAFKKHTGTTPTAYRKTS